MDYKTSIRTFTVSMGPKRGWGEAGKLWHQFWAPPAPQPHNPTTHGPVHMPQVAADVLEDLCQQMGITDPCEVQEFALFLIKREGEPLAWGRSGDRLDARRQLTYRLYAYKWGRFLGRGCQDCGQDWTSGRAVDLGSLFRRAGAAPVAP